MNKLLKISGVVFSLLLLAVVSATAQVKKKTIVRKTSVSQSVKVADLSCFDLKGKVHTCVEWSNAGAGRNKRIFSSNGKWIGYRDDAGWNIWKNISGLRRDAKGRIVFIERNMRIRALQEPFLTTQRDVCQRWSLYMTRRLITPYIIITARACW